MMTSLTDADLDRLDALAAAATPGPWELDEDGGGIETTGGGFVAHVQPHGNVNTINRTGETYSHADGRYLAALDPTTARRLVADLRAARAELARVGPNDRAHANTWREEAERLSDLEIRQRQRAEAAEAELAAHRKNRWLALDDNSPHDDPADCPSWYDWCNCTVASLRSASDLAKRQRSELDTLRAELAACREALRPLAEHGAEWVRQNGTESAAWHFATIPAQLLVNAARLAASGVVPPTTLNQKEAQ